MVDIMKLKGKIAEKGFTQNKLAKCLNITDRTMTERMKTGVFKTNEIDLIRSSMGLSDKECIDIFFAKKVS